MSLLMDQELIKPGAVTMRAGAQDCDTSGLGLRGKNSVSRKEPWLPGRYEFCD